MYVVIYLYYDYLICEYNNIYSLYNIYLVKGIHVCKSDGYYK